MDFKKIGASLALAAALSSASSPVLAQSTDGIQEMQDSVTAISGVKDAAIPIAVSVIVFGGGALVLKRLIYA